MGGLLQGELDTHYWSVPLHKEWGTLHWWGCLPRRNGCSRPANESPTREFQQQEKWILRFINFLYQEDYDRSSELVWEGQQEFLSVCPWFHLYASCVWHLVFPCVPNCQKNDLTIGTIEEPNLWIHGNIFHHIVGYNGDEEKHLCVIVQVKVIS